MLLCRFQRRRQTPRHRIRGCVTRIWDIDGGGCTACKGHALTILHVAFSPTETILLTVSSDGTARLWNADTGEQKCEFKVPGTSIYYGSFSQAGDRLVTICRNGHAQIWNCQGEKLGDEFETHDLLVPTIRFLSSDDSEGERLATASWDGTARIWNAEGKELVKFSLIRGQMLRARFNPAGDKLATNAWDGAVHLWDLGQHPPLASREPVVLDDDPTTVFNWATFSPDGDRIAAVGLDRKVRLYSALGDLFLWTRLSNHEGRLYCVDFGPSGTGMMATASHDRTGRLWSFNGDRLEERQCLKGHKGPVYAISFSSRGERVVTASEDGTVRFWGLDGKEKKDCRFRGGWPGLFSEVPSHRKRGSDGVGQWCHSAYRSQRQADRRIIGLMARPALLSASTSVAMGSFWAQCSGTEVPACGDAETNLRSGYD